MPVVKIDTAVLRQMYDAGATRQEIAERFDCAQSAVYRALKAMGVTHRRRPSVKATVDRAKLAELWPTLMSTVDIGLVLGCSGDTVLRPGASRMDRRFTRRASRRRSQHGSL